MKRAKKSVAKKKSAKKKVVKAKAAKRSAVKKPAIAKKPGQPGADGTVTWNFKLLSHNLLDGFGGMGEGMSVQIAPDGRRIIWLAHESAPKNFTAVDVSDPRKPKVVCQTDLPQSHMRSNSLEICGNLMAVAYQTQKTGLQPAGFELFDISEPGEAEVDRLLRLLRPAFARRASALVLRRRIRAHGRRAAPDFEPTHPLDDQFYRCIDVRNPSKPAEVGRWWHARHQAGRQRRRRRRATRSTRATAHTTRNVYPQRPDRLYLAYIDGGMHHPGHFRQGQPEARSTPGPTRRHIPASCTPWCRCSTVA